MRRSTRRPPRFSVFLGIFAALVVVLIAPVQAQAAFNAGVGQAVVLGTPTLQPPTGVTLTTACGSVLANPATMTVSWTPSTYANAGYTVVPSVNGVAQSAVTVAGQSTSSVTIQIIRNALLGPNTWTVTIYARAGTAWTSANAAPPTPATVNCPYLSL